MSANHPKMSPLGRRAATLVELLAALAVSMILVAAMASSFIQIIRVSDEAEAQSRASQSARLAVDALASELAIVTTVVPFSGQALILIDRPLTYGDNIDNDGDGQVDEEVFNGLDDDGDWVELRDDNHAEIGAFVERRHGVGIPDHGDFRVDEDCVFSADEISWIVPPALSGSGTLERITYSLGSFEGENHVLLRRKQTNFGTAAEEVFVEPIVFEVLSLDILAWTSNTDSPLAGRRSGYWLSSWNSIENANSVLLVPLNAPGGTPAFELPTAFLISVVVNAERLPLSELPDVATSGRPIRTVRATTIIPVEATLLDPRYTTFVRQPVP